MITEALHIINLIVEEHYTLSSLQINLPEAHSDFVLKWGREMIPDEHLYYDEKGGRGRENEPHATVLFGLKEIKPSQVLLDLIRKTSPFTVRLTSVTLFDNNPDYDVVKFDVDSSELEALSSAVRQACPNENKFPKFHGHVTIAYVKKGRVPDLAGNYPFEQNPPIPSEFEVNEIIFKPPGDSQDPKRVPVRLALNRYRKEAESPKAFLKGLSRDAARSMVWEYKLKYDVDHDGLYQANFYLGGKWHGCLDRGYPTKAAADSVAHDDLHLLNAKQRVDPYPNHLGFLESPAVREWLWYPPGACREVDEAKQLPAPSLYRITRPLPFWQIPEGFYFRNAANRLVKKQSGASDSDPNAAILDSDTTRNLCIGSQEWMSPPEWGDADQALGKKLESLLEMESPKAFLRSLSSKRDPWVIWLRLYEKILFLRVTETSRGLDTQWVADPAFASVYSSHAEAIGMEDYFFTVAQTVEYGISADLLSSVISLKSRMVEAESPKEFLRNLPREPWVIWSSARGQYATGSPHFLRAFEDETLDWSWVANPKLASRYRSKQEADYILDLCYDPSAIAVDRMKVSLFSQVPKFEPARSPFDLLNFPTDSAVLVAKLLEPEPDEKVVVL